MNLKPVTYLKRDFNKWAVLTLTIVSFVSIPVLTIAVKLFYGPGETWGHIVENLLWEYTLNSIILIFGCGILTVVLGVSSAWCVSRYQFRFQKQIEWLLILPLTIPFYITAYAYAGFFDYGGSFENLLASLDVEPFKFNVMSITGLVFVLSLSLYPYVYVASRIVFLYQSSRLIEASKILGANELKTFFRIVLPIAGQTEKNKH